MTSAKIVRGLFSDLKDAVIAPIELWDRRNRLRGVSDAVKTARSSSSEGKGLSPDTISILNDLEEKCESIESELSKDVPNESTLQTLTTQATGQLTEGLTRSFLARSKNLLQSCASTWSPGAEDKQTPALDQTSLASVVSSWLYFEKHGGEVPSPCHIYNAPSRLDLWLDEKSQAFSGPDPSNNGRMLLAALAQELEYIKNKVKDPKFPGQTLKSLRHSAAAVFSRAQPALDASSCSQTPTSLNTHLQSTQNSVTSSNAPAVPG